ncbi:MAG: TM2 domain protein [Caudoviricetes sp.]|nr:MAG: TM2 domain protein [Caudoviricetes sp.]
MYCQKCGSEIRNGESKCPNCGALREGLKFCQHCGQAIDKDCVVCPKCGKQVGQIKQDQPQIVINNSNDSINTNANVNTNINRAGGYGQLRNKWVAFSLCLFLGYFGVHKFYEGKILMGVVYLFTLGLFGIGWFIDLIVILLKPNPYFV